MKLLLDTCTFLWAIRSPHELSLQARDLITDPHNEVFLSAISVWEIMVKVGLGTLKFAEPAARAVPRYREAHGFSSLALDDATVTQLPKLPALHRDPFDRMLVCQAIQHGFSLVTPDVKISQYPVRVVW